MSNPILNEDLKKAISSAVIKEGKTKEGNTYTYIDLEFANGYTKRVFVNSDSLFGLKDALVFITKNDKKSVSSSFWDED